MTVASCKINLQSKHDSYFWRGKSCNVSTLQAYSLQIQRFVKTERKYILHITKKTIFVTISLYSMFEQQKNK